MSISLTENVKYIWLPVTAKYNGRHSGLVVKAHAIVLKVVGLSPVQTPTGKLLLAVYPAVNTHTK